MEVTPEGFSRMTRFLTDCADKHSKGNIVFILEGGYNLDGLWISNKEVVEELLDKKKSDYNVLEDTPQVDSIIENVKKEYSAYWDF